MTGTIDMTHIEQLKALVECGKKAYLGDKVISKYSGNAAALFDEHSDVVHLAILNCLDFDKGQNKVNADFFAQAANSRHALEKVLADYERMRELLIEMNEYLSRSDIEQIGSKSIFHRQIKALTEEQGE